VFIIYILDFEGNEIFDISPKKSLIMEYIKKELDELRQIDNVVKALLRADEINFQRDLGIHPVQHIENVEQLVITINENCFKIPKEIIDKLRTGFRILYVTERMVLVPILVAPKWIKGLIKEKYIEMQLLSPGFTMEKEKFHLIVTEFDSELSQSLNAISSGIVLVLYTLFSQIN